jgi:hypothetical protein
LQKTQSVYEEKIKEKIKEMKKIRRALWTFDLLIHLTQPGEVVLPNIFLKRLQLHQKSCSTREARAILGEAGAFPNTPSQKPKCNTRYMALFSHQNGTCAHRTLYTYGSTFICENK